MIVEKTEDLSLFRQNEIWPDGWEETFNILRTPNKHFSVDVFIGKENDEVVTGCIVFNMDGVSILFHLFTPEQHRRKGYAKELCRYVMDNFDKGSSIMTARTIRGYYVETLYRSLGWKYFNEQKINSSIILGYEH